MSKSRSSTLAWIQPAAAGIPLFLALLPVACGGGGTTSGTTGTSSSASTAAGGAGGAGGGESSSSSSGGGTTGSGGQGGSGGSGVCSPGAQKPCYEGPAGTLGVGLCKAGVQTCDAAGAAFGACVGQVLPSVETCATPGDDDCNGQVNEGGDGCVCVPGTMTACYTGLAGTLGVGLCKGGMHLCNALGTAYGACAGEITPQAETCATPGDDDCNGQVNEGGAGCVCAPGATVSCYTGPAGSAGVGACALGSQVCDAQGTSLSACVGSVLPQAEICGDSLDNNCDGQVNNGCLCAPGSTTPCYTGPASTQGVGPCKSGTQTCNASGNGYGACAGEVLPQAETCSTPIDDDCNGQVNEGGAGCVCAPSAMVSCYTGPAGTGGVGICAPGSQTCDAQGTSLTACVGSVLPQLENCATPADEDCDGAAATCSGTHLWSRAWGGNLDDEGNSLSVDAADNIFYGGYITGPVDMGCGALPVASGVDAAVLMKLTPGGTCIWSKAFGQNSQMLSVVVDPSGNLLTTGMYGVNINLGGGLVTSLGGNDGFVAKFDTLGNLIWSKYFGDAAAQTPDTVATDAAGDLIAYGYFNGTVDFGGGPLTSAGGSDLYVAKFSPTGTLIWAKRFGDGQNQLARGLAVDPAGNVLITGSFNGNLNFGGATLTSAGLGDVFVAKLGPTGNHIWSKRFGDGNDQLGAGLATSAAGDVYITGSFLGTMNFGGAALPSLGGADSYIAKLDSTGAHVWSMRGGGPSGQAAVGVAVDPVGNVAMIGVMAGSASFGGPTLTSAGSADIVVARYDPTGKHLWSKLFGNSALQGVKGITTDSKGNVLVTGLMNGPTDFGGGPVTAGGGEDTYLAKLSP
jgi:hypothetical protein